MERKKLRRKPVRGIRYSNEYKTLIKRETKLRGKYVVIVDSKVFTAKTGEQAARVLARVRKRYPGKTPLATYLPKAETLILWL